MPVVAPPPPPVLAPLKPCYVSVESAPDAYTTEGMAVSGTGFDPGERLQIMLDGATVVSGLTAAEDGTLAPQPLNAPVQPAGERAFAITLVREADGVVRATAGSRVTALGVKVRPKRARPRRRVRFKGRGFTYAAPVYAHYVRKGLLYRTVRLVDAPTGACGTFSVRRAQFPFSPSEGVWRIQIDQHTDLTADGPLVNLAVDVKRRPLTQP